MGLDDFSSQQSKTLSSLSGLTEEDQSQCAAGESAGTEKVCISNTAEKIFPPRRLAKVDDIIQGFMDDALDALEKQIRVGQRLVNRTRETRRKVKLEKREMRADIESLWRLVGVLEHESLENTGDADKDTMVPQGKDATRRLLDGLDSYRRDLRATEKSLMTYQKMLKGMKEKLTGVKENLKDDHDDEVV